MPDTVVPLPDPAAQQSRAPLLIAAACVVPAILDAFQAYMQARLAGRPAAWRMIAFQGSEWLFLGALTPITYQLARRFPLNRTPRRTLVAVHGAGALVLCIGWASAGIAFQRIVGMLPDGASLGGAYLSWVLTSVPWSVFMYFTVLGCVYAFAYFGEAREREAQSARLAGQLAEARLGALRTQLHPHFLFNSLNAIGVLVRDQNTQAASRMIELLGDILRKVLRGDQAHEIPLAGELDFIAQYLAIEEVRFSDRLRVRWSIDERTRSALVPSFILQPLVENALRHGLAKRSEAGDLEIASRVAGEHLVLSVTDDGAGMSPTATSGVGLSNTRERLRAMYGDAARLELARSDLGGTVATLYLPFRAAPHA